MLLEKLSMASRGSLARSGLSLGLIGALIAILIIVLGFTDIDLGNIPTDQVLDVSLNVTGTLGTILQIFFILLLYLICAERVTIQETGVLGIFVVLLGILINNIGGFIAVIGGVLIILDALFDSA